MTDQAPPGLDVADLIRAERLALVDLLETLSDSGWETQSLCSAWRVQEVAAHLAWMPLLSFWSGAVGLARAGFRVNRFGADSAMRWSSRGRPAILAQLRSNAASGVRPFGTPPAAALADAIVHGLDIRRPLGVHRDVPEPAFAVIAEWCVGLGWPKGVPVGGSVERRIAGLRLVATDADWSHGRGDEVRGGREALLLALHGRPVRPGELTGPGAPRLGG
jgi:uncharacterized protein (TIGR03083 family)